ncbi:MAG: hydantoinase/oxoprolinase family protein [Actinomycetales bacterium]
MNRSTRVAVDVGGTFTDVVRLDTETGELRFDKVPTTPQAPTRGVLDAFEKVGAAAPHVTMFTHGTTLGLNALLTRTGARMAVVGTGGFRDVYLLGRTDRRVNYDITYRKPPALVERYDTFEVVERCLFDGTVHRELDEEIAAGVAREIGRRGYESVAVAFLHSYANPAHELRMREILTEHAPDTQVTLSHELSREYREFERTSTAALDAYIKPIVRTYLHTLQKHLDDNGFQGRFLMTRSGGGAMTATSAREMPVSLVLSGPAGGVIGAAAYSRLLEEPNLITIDMGGTSLDASLILDHETVLYQGAEFEGMPINMPSLYIHTVGSGGGSIAWLDPAGVLQVGPRSAGATPGPASYGRGGTEPTFTDSAVMLGYLGSDAALGGTLRLDADLALAAHQPLAEALSMTTHELARGIVGISTTKIVGAVRAITVDLGRDPHDFTLLSLGGAGGLVCVAVARELGIGTVVVPPGQGAFCAFGMLMADVQHDFSRTRIMPLADFDPETAEDAYQAMEHAARQRLATDGFGPEKQSLGRLLDVRYTGQEHSVTLPYPTLDENPREAVARDFSRTHQAQYGHTMPDPIEVTTSRVRAVGLVDKPEIPALTVRDAGVPTPATTRAVYLDADHPGVPYPLYVREDLRAGDRLAGPVIIAEQTATTVVPAGDTVEVGAHGELTITLRADREHR